VGFAPSGRASLALPRAILRVAAEKAGAGMHRLGFFGQGAFTGMGFPTAPLTKKARCLSTASFLLTRDSVGIRTQDPQLRRLLLYPAELPNHPAYSAGKKGRAGESDCKYRYYLLFGNVFSAESFFWPQNRYNICRKYGILVI
jgi:hypothetical protein